MHGETGHRLLPPSHKKARKYLILPTREYLPLKPVVPMKIARGVHHNLLAQVNTKLGRNSFTCSETSCGQLNLLCRELCMQSSFLVSSGIFRCRHLNEVWVTGECPRWPEMQSC
jgi:hypothetical protein